MTACPPISEGGLGQISDWLTAHTEARLVVIDVFARIRGRGDPSASMYDVDYTAMAALKGLADRHSSLSWSCITRGKQRPLTS